MNTKKVRYLLPAVTIDMAGMPVKQPLPTQKVSNLDPFLLLHHAQTLYSGRRPAKHQGVGPHPHRGFSPVTFVVEGEVYHRDSRGNAQIAKAGEVQWLHAGSGIIHSERPSENLIATTRRQEIIQLWVNTPQAFKMDAPAYYHVTKETMPTVSSPDSLVHSQLIAGEYAGLQGPIPTKSELMILWANGDKGGTMQYVFTEGFASTVYLIKGRLRIEGYGVVDAEHMVVLEADGDATSISVLEDASFILLSGKPIGEKIAQQGPFVMNTETELLEAMRDYRMGKMGFLVEED